MKGLHDKTGMAYGTGTAADCLFLPLSSIYLGENNLSCVPLTASRLSAFTLYIGPSTTCVGVGNDFPVEAAPWTVVFGACIFSGDPVDLDLRHRYPLCSIRHCASLSLLTHTHTYENTHG